MTGTPPSSRFTESDADALYTPLASWQDYTPVLTAVTTNPTLGAGSAQVGRYLQLGKLVAFSARIVFGAAPNAGNGNYELSLPVAMAAGWPTSLMAGHANYADASASTRRSGVVIQGATTSKVWLLYDDATAFVSNALPWAWAQSDIIYVAGCYEAA